MKTFKILITALLVSCLFSCDDKPGENDVYNTKAAVPQKFDVAKLHLVVINTSINEKDSTMSILYGNPLAYSQLKQGIGIIKNGGLLALVTWKQQADVHWFGANIPGELLSVEYVKADSVGHGIKYRRLLGQALQEDPDTLHSAEREVFIMSQKPSVMP
jgi:hypothetical protein